MDKEDVVYTQQKTTYPLKKKKKNEILPYAATCMDLEGIVLSEVKSDKERQILCGITYTWKLKNKTSE